MSTKKYVSLDKLGLYDAKIKGVISAGDADTLASAKQYFEDNAERFDVAGAAATAESNAKTYTDTEVAKANAAAATAQAQADKGVADAATADAKAVAAQTDVDNLETYVGTFTASEGVDTVVKYIDAKTANIASDEVVSALGDRVTQAEKDIDAIESDYLKSTDKTELEGKITTAQEAADAAQDYAEGVAGDLASAVEALEGADDGQIERISALEETIVGLSGAMHFEGVKDEVPTDVTGYEQGDVIIVGNKEYVLNGTTFVEFGDATVNAEAITALTGRVGTLETDMGTAKTDIDNVEAAVETKAEKTYVDEADEALSGRITTLEGKFGDGEGSVSDMISDAVDAEATRVDGLLDKKVDKVDGKGLSTNDLTNDLKANYDEAYTHSQAAHAPVNAQENIIESVKVNGTALTITDKAVDVTVPTDNAQLTNGAGYLVANDIANKADKSTTLAGYGISDAYTTTQTDTAIANAIGQFEEASESEINSLFA